MKKSELIEAVAQSAGLSKAQAGKTVAAMMESIEESLSQGQTLRLTGFGSFYLTERKARTARNPRSGEMVQVAAKKVVKFKPGKELSAAVA